MGLNGLLGFKSPTHLMPTQTHPFDTPTNNTKNKNKKNTQITQKKKKKTNNII
jgi:hypothetical protein